MHPSLEGLGRLKLMPVVILEDVAAVAPLCDTLLRAGLPAAEFTLRGAGSLACLREALKRHPEMQICAGSVVKREMAEAACDAGAQLIVTPGFSSHILDWCREHDHPVLPGCSSPSDFMQASQNGLQMVKFFPAESLGGLPVLQAMAAPFPDLRFVPTGGITAGNLHSYLSEKRVSACGGSWMVHPALLHNQDWQEVERLTREAVAIIQTLEG